MPYKLACNQPIVVITDAGEMKPKLLYMVVMSETENAFHGSDE